MPRRILQGVVTSDASNKTISVLVSRRFMHPAYKKIITRSKKYAVHDESNSFRKGDDVKIVECRPISKTKRWQILQNRALES